MTTIINGSSPSITFSDSTTQTTAFGSASAVTSAIGGNGITVSSATGAVTSNIACPAFNTVGSYAVGNVNGYNSVAANTIYSAAGAGISGGAGNWRCMGITGYTYGFVCPGGCNAPVFTALSTFGLMCRLS